MNEEHVAESERPSLGDYIVRNSEVLYRKDDLTEELARLAVPNRGLFGFYDSRDIKFTVDGYDFVFFDDELNLKHVKIRPGDVSDLDRRNKIGESDELAGQLHKLGYTLDQSEKFRSALHRQLNG